MKQTIELMHYNLSIPGSSTSTRTSSSPQLSSSTSLVTFDKFETFGVVGDRAILDLDMVDLDLEKLVLHDLLSEYPDPPRIGDHCW